MCLPAHNHLPSRHVRVCVRVRLASGCAKTWLVPDGSIWREVCVCVYVCKSSWLTFLEVQFEDLGGVR